MAWYNPSWPKRFKLTIASSQVPGDLTDFPVFFDLADIGGSHGFWSAVKSDGGDIRITKADETTEVAREIVDIDTVAKTGSLMFKGAGTISSTVDTDFYVYYGNSGASDYAPSATYGAENVWDSNTLGVWHLDEANAEDVRDSGPNGVHEHDDVPTDTTISTATSVAGKIGTCFDFNGSSNLIAFEDGVLANLAPTSSMQFELWFNADAFNDCGILSVLQDSTVRGYGFWFWSGQLRAQIGSNGWSNLTYPTSSLSTNTWYHICANWDGSTYRLYLDGTQVDSGPYGGSQLYFGTQMLFGKRELPNWYNGRIDEVRIHAVARSADWIAATSNNQNSPSTFYSVAAEEENTVIFLPRHVSIF